MKTKDITQDLRAVLLKVDKRSLRYLKQILGPLEFSALRHNYQPFNYRVEGHFIYISDAACKQLMENTKHQISFFTNQVEKDKYWRKVPQKVRKVFEYPAEILGLPAYIRKHLCRLRCYTMFKIMVLGRQYFLSRKEFGSKSIKAIENLFEKHKCGHLFK